MLYLAEAARIRSAEALHQAELKMASKPVFYQAAEAARIRSAFVMASKFVFNQAAEAARICSADAARILSTAALSQVADDARLRSTKALHQASRQAKFVTATGIRAAESIRSTKALRLFAYLPSSEMIIHWDELPPCEPPPPEPPPWGLYIFFRSFNRFDNFFRSHPHQMVHVVSNRNSWPHARTNQYLRNPS